MDVLKEATLPHNRALLSSSPRTSPRKAVKSTAKYSVPVRWHTGCSWPAAVPSANDGCSWVWCMEAVGVEQRCRIPKTPWHRRITPTRRSASCLPLDPRRRLKSLCCLLLPVTAPTSYHAFFRRIPSQRAYCPTRPSAYLVPLPTPRSGSARSCRLDLISARRTGGP